MPLYLHPEVFRVSESSVLFVHVDNAGDDRNSNLKEA